MKVLYSELVKVLVEARCKLRREEEDVLVRIYSAL
jgi:hypothetical protein